MRETATGIEIVVRVVPRSRRTAVDGVRNGALVIRLSAPPVDEAANAQLVETLAELLRIPRRQVRLVAGTRTRHKRVLVTGLTAAAVRERIGPGNQGRAAG